MEGKKNAFLVHGLVLIFSTLLQMTATMQRDQKIISH